MPTAVLVILVALAGSTLAHGTSIPHDLAGVTPCVDDASISVSFDRDPSGLLARLVGERVERAVHTTLNAASVPWQRLGACPEGRGYLEIALHVRDASSFAPRASDYDLAVRVGWRQAHADGARAEPPDAFDFSGRDLFDEAAVGVPAFVYLPGYLEAGLRDLSVSWWEDRQEAASALPRWVPWAGAALALLSSSACAAVLGRRRRGRGRCAATAGAGSRAYHRS